jgi:hypothetical protein
MKLQRTTWTGMECGTCVFSQTDTTDLIIFLITQQLYALITQIYFGKNSTCFGHFLCPSSEVFHCTYTQQLYM